MASMSAHRSFCPELEERAGAAAMPAFTDDRSDDRSALVARIRRGVIGPDASQDDVLELIVKF